MYQLDPRPYPKLTPEQKDRMLRQVAWYLATMARYRIGQQGAVEAAGEQLELFPAGTSERLDVPNV
jgi:hypothetical protein